MSEYVKIPSKETSFMRHVTTHLAGAKSGRFVDAGFEGSLMEDGDYTLTKGELADSIVILMSEEFDTFCYYVAQYQKSSELLNEKYDELIRLNDAPNSSQLYDLQRYAKRCGAYRAKSGMLKESIIERMGWSAWINATRLYETIFQIPRERLD